MVIEHVAGKGRHKGRLGALVVQMPDGTEFSVGTGFSDKQRASPPPVGSTITYRYQELSTGGVPRFPSFVRCRADAGSASPATQAPSGKPAAASPAKTAVSTEPEKKAEAKPAGVSTAGSGEKRYFEFVEGTSAKFWEICVTGTDVTVRFGRIGSDGQTKTKSFPNESVAREHAESLIEEKTGKRYAEKS